MRRIVVITVALFAAAANAALWQGIGEENRVFGPPVSERDLLGKVVLVVHLFAAEGETELVDRAEALWKGYDHRRFRVLGVCCGDPEKLSAELSRRKVTFPVYRGVRIATDRVERSGGDALVVNRYGRIIISSGAPGRFSRDVEQTLVEAIMELGTPPDVISGVTLDKYRSLKGRLKFGSDLSGVVKTLEKDIAAAAKKSAPAALKARAEEAAAIVSAIRRARSAIMEDISALADADPQAAHDLLSQYVRSFPEEAQNSKEKLAELKVRAVEVRKMTK